jgi:hypothetical protein
MLLMILPILVPVLLVSLLMAPAREGKRPLDQGAPRQENDIAAPVVYESNLLVFTTEKGVTAVRFYEPISEENKSGIHYEFRYESRDGKLNNEGKGELYESRDEAGTLVGRLRLQVEGLSIGWSTSGTQRGWIYYEPEKVKVQLADPAEFHGKEERRFPDGVLVAVPPLDLKRFQQR